MDSLIILCHFFRVLNSRIRTVWGGKELGFPWIPKEISDWEVQFSVVWVELTLDNAASLVIVMNVCHGNSEEWDRQHKCLFISFSTSLFLIILFRRDCHIWKSKPPTSCEHHAIPRLLFSGVTNDITVWLGASIKDVRGRGKWGQPKVDKLSSLM